MNIFIGVDPGKSGAWAYLSEDMSLYAVHKFPSDISDLVNQFEDIINDDTIALAAIEKNHAAPRQRASATFTHGENYGMWQAAFAFMRIPYMLVAPKMWMYKTFDSIKRKDETKKVSLAFAKRRFPNASIGKDDGKADALNIALYARNEFLKEG